MKKRLRISYTCCAACHSEHNNKFTAWLHWLWMRAMGQA